MFKENFAKALEVYEKFWNREPLKRCVLNANSSLGLPPFRNYEDLEEKWLSEEYNYNLYKHNEKNAFHAAEGVSMLFTNLGPGCLSACIGGDFKLAPRTIWFENAPVVTDWENPPKVKLDTESPMWKHLVRLQEKYALDPDVCFSATDIGGVMDVVSSLRGAENLLYDLYDYPEEVKAFTDEVEKIWYEVFDQQCETIRKAGLPYNSWMNIPSEKPWYPLQCDFCAMISPKQFEEFILPHIDRQAKYMPRSIYHLDGPGEIPHLDMLLDIPELTGIQWTSGAGNLPIWDKVWHEMYRKIQDKKKNIVLLGGISEHDLAGAEALIKSIDPTGVYISLWASTPDKLKMIIELIEKWSS